ncbi:MAG: UDP-N-acetylmuramoyl-L-alanine--D-glutamate ligase [Gallionella sp.]
MMELKNKSVLILGLGETGLSMLRHLKSKEVRLSAADTRANPSGLVEAMQYVNESRIACGPLKDELFVGIDLIAISPGVPLRDPVIARAVSSGIPVVGDIELFAWTLPEQGRPRVLAITGSNGKTTVTSMVEHLCKAAGKSAVAAGNISPAVLDVVKENEQPDIWALELSSFQLESTSTLHADAATVLNVCEDHMDRYDSMDEYAKFKARIFGGAKVQVLNRDDARSLAMSHQECTKVTFGLSAPDNEQDFGLLQQEGSNWLAQGMHALLKVEELKVNGLHNAANALAALALCRAIDLPMDALLDGLRSYEGLPHRVSLVAEINDVLYYDDSKGTNVGATVAALEGLGRKAVLIAGGEGKGQDFSPLKSAVQRSARGVVLIGRDAHLIEAALQDCGVPVVYGADMVDAVSKAAELAQPGDAVLLSPACASFDMFRDYKHRAEAFIGAVRDLKVRALA